MIKSKDLPLSLRLTLQATIIMSNFYLIISFSDVGFGHLLTLCDVESPTSILPNVGDQVP